MYSRDVVAVPRSRNRLALFISPTESIAELIDFCYNRDAELAEAIWEDFFLLMSLSS